MGPSACRRGEYGEERQYGETEALLAGGQAKTDIPHVHNTGETILFYHKWLTKKCLKVELFWFLIIKHVKVIYRYIYV